MLHQTPLEWWTDEEVALSREVNDFADSLRARNMEAIWSHDVPRDVIAEIGRRRYFGAVVPQEYGGMSNGDGDATRLSIIMEALGRVPAAAMAYGVGCAHHIAAYGNDAQRERWLPGLAAGEILGAVAVTEPYAGSDAGGIQTFARRAGDGYVLHGRKRYITHTGLADVYLVYAATSEDPEEIRARRHLSAFLVPAKAPGVNVERLYDLAGSQYLRNGILHFDNVSLSRDLMLGDQGDGWQVMTAGLNVERVAVACKCLGMLGEAVATAWQWLHRRHQFGVSLDRVPTIQAHLGTIIAEGMSVRTSAYHAARLADSDPAGAGLEASASKLLASSTALRGASTALELMGADGYSRQYPVFQFMQDLRLFQVGAGSNEVMRGLVFRLGAKRFAETLTREPNAMLPPTLRPEESAAPSVESAAELSTDELTDAILAVLGDFYRMHQGLHMRTTDLRRRLPGLDTSGREFAAAVSRLEDKGLAHVVRKDGEVVAVRPTYLGLDNAHESDFYHLIPDWATDLS